MVQNAKCILIKMFQSVKLDWGLIFSSKYSIGPIFRKIFHSDFLSLLIFFKNKTFTALAKLLRDLVASL